MKTPDKKNIEDILALTPMQEGMLFHYLKNPQSELYFEQLSLELSGIANIELLEQAWNQVVASNQMLRSVFRWEKMENPVQVVLRKHNFQPVYYDLSDSIPGETKRKLEEIKLADRRNNFNLQDVSFRVTLCKLQEAKSEMMISYHHILFDGWSCGIILEELFQTYNDLHHGRTPSTPTKTNFKEFLKWIDRQDQEEEKKFWQDYLTGFEEPTSLSVKKIGVKRKETAGTGNLNITIPKKMRELVEKFVHHYKITPAALFYSAWGFLLQRYNDSDDMLFGTTVSGRTAKIPGIEKMVGLFINTTPLRIKTNSHETIMDLLYRIDDQLKARQRVEYTSLVKIKEYCEIENQGELFDTIVVIENYPLSSRLKRQKGPLSVSSYSMQEMTHYDLTVEIALFDEIELTFAYQRDKFDEDIIRRLSGHFREIVKEILTLPGKKVSNLEMITRAEKRELLYDFNDTNRPYPAGKTIHQLFEEQVERTPDHVALVGVHETHEKHEKNYNMSHLSHLSHMSYKELNEKSQQLARILAGKGVEPNSIVAIIVGPSLEMMVGILGILKAGGAYLPIDQGYPEERIQYMLIDSSAKVLLAAPADQVKGETIERIDISDLLSFSTLTLTSTCPVSPVNLAYIIYTSGSTGKPKGVLLEHRSVVNTLSVLDGTYPFKESDVYLLKTSYTFDVSVTELFGWFHGGGMLAVLEKHGQKDPYEILAAIEIFGVTHINFVPSMFNVFVNILDQENIGKLSGLKYIFLAGEALLPDPVKKFRELNSEIVLENLYGPTEAAVYASRYSLSDWDSRGNIPIGKPLSNVGLYVSDMYGHLQPIGIAGELGISGCGLARGYLNNPALTAEKFDQELWDYHDKINKSFCGGSRGAVFSKRAPLAAGGKIYKTGDLARWLPDGNIEFLGRMDHQVKIRGYRIEPGEIETQLLKHEKIKDAVVVSRGAPGGEQYLCAYIVPKRAGAFAGKPGISVLRDFLSAALADYMVPAYFVSMENFPRTATGKIDRKALPGPGIKSAAPYVAPGNEREALLVDIWAGVLGIDKSRIGIDDNFFEMGGHSLKITGLIGRIHKESNIRIPFGEIFKTPTVRGLAAYMAKKEKSRYASILPVEKKEYYPLSPAQKRLFVLQQMEVDSIFYNIHGIMRLEGAPDRERLDKVFRQLIDRHEILGTSFHIVNNKPIQKINQEVKFEIENYDFSNHCPAGKDKSCARIIKDFIRPFDLAQASLLRVGLINNAPPERGPDAAGAASPIHHKKGNLGSGCILMVDMHHIISDGTSLGVFIREFISLYKGVTLPAAGIRYKDFAEWTKSRKAGEVIKAQEAYWLKQYRGEIPLLNLPTDFPRPAVQSFAGAHLEFEINEKETKALKALALEANATLYGVLAAVFHILLSKLSGQEDIVVGTVVMGRKHMYMELNQVIGMFVNTLALRQYPHGEKNFMKFVREIAARTAEAFENQEYPFEELVERLAVTRDPGRNPLFDVVFAMQNMEIPKICIPGMKMEPYPYDDGVAKFDLVFICEPAGEQLVFTVEYCIKIFRRATIERYIKYFKKIVTEALGEREKRLGEIEIITPEEKQEILNRFNHFEPDYARDKTLVQLFQEQAAKVPERAAIVSPDRPGPKRTNMSANMEIIPRLKTEIGELHLTYKLLNEKSNRMAHKLRRQGVKPGELAAILVERSIEMLVGILAILKTGSAYVPLNTRAPEARNEYILKESNIKLMLTDGKLIKENETVRIGTWEGKTVLITTTDKGNPGRESGFPAARRDASTYSPTPLDLAYIIYTSGSTGNPKGVPITHGNLSPLLHWGYRHLGIGIKDRTLQNLAYYFDWSVWEIFITLTCGAALYIVPEEVLLNPGLCIDFINRHVITILHLTPTQYQYLVNTGRKTGTLNYLFIGAEKLTVDLVNRCFKAVSRDCRVFNMYGPTEATIISSVLEINRVDYHEFKSLTSVPIGKPSGNTILLVLDKYLKLCPVNVVGELFVGGEGLSRGYLNQPELTSERFRTVFNRSYKSCETYFSNKLYRTGDLVRWLSNGIVEFLGRIDYQVKIRGFRIELGEIENHLLTHKNVKEAVVVDLKTKDEEKYLCAYVVLLDENDNRYKITAALKDYLSGLLPDYMVPSYIIPIKNIPLNPNGKVDRRALPEPEIRIAGPAYCAPRNPLEEKLTAIWSEVLQSNRPIGIDDNFFEIGGHSLKATLLISKIHQAFDVKLRLTEIFVSPSIRQLAPYIEASAQDHFSSISPTEKEDFYPLSSAQKRLYLLYRINPQSIGYNIPVVMEVEGEIHKEKFENTIRELIRRHESLRTYFQEVDGNPVQRIRTAEEFGIDEVKVEEEEAHSGQDLNAYGGQSLKSRELRAKTRIHSFIRPFDLTRAPLMRVGLIKLLHPPTTLRGHPGRGTYNSQEGKKDRYLLMMDIHHIISDGTSMGILVKEFMALYEGKKLPETWIQYKDFAVWSNRERAREMIKEQEAYWLKQFQGEIPLLNLPADFTRPAVQSFEGAHLGFEINQMETKALRALALEAKATLYGVLVAVFDIFLSKLSGQEDIVIGTPVIGRKHMYLDLYQVIGMFVNTLALRHFPSGEKNLINFVREISYQTSEAFENQEYPFEMLVERLAVKRDASRNPLFDVVFAMQDMEIPEICIPGLKMEPYPCDDGIAKFHLVFTCEPAGERLLFTVDYCTKIFKSNRVEKFIKYFKKVVSGTVKDREKRIGDFEIISAEEKQEILHQFNNFEPSFVKDKTLVQLFEEQAATNPGHIALVGNVNGWKGRGVEGKMHLTYHELNEKSGQMAYSLCRQGVKPGELLAILVGRSIEMIVGILAILKSGCAYIPLNPKAPTARNEYILKDCNIKRVLTTAEFAEEKVKADEWEVQKNFQIVLIDFSAFTTPPLHLEPVPATCLAYIIYTSGSTGKPKGVPITHGNLSPLLHWGYRHLGIGIKDRTLQNLAYYFDWSVWEMFITLTCGAALYIVPEEVLLNPGLCIDFINRHVITILHLTPTQYQYLVNTGRKTGTLHYLFIGAEKLTVDLVKRSFSAVSRDCRVFNMYGPTEATIISSVLEINRVDYHEFTSLTSVPIGKPSGNTILLVLDKYLKLCPVNVVGELYVGGDGVSRGYLNRPELTSERFRTVFNRSYKSYETYFSNKLYCTGDLVRWLSNGIVEFLGRIDYQVKIRGFRIELGEIENHLLTHKNVKEAVVIDRKTKDEEKYLCAYVVLADENDNRYEIAALLKDYLSGLLPDYMVPSYIIPIKNIPLNPNGKVDRRALPEPETMGSGPAYYAPRNSLEKKLAAIWSEVLQSNRSIGIDDNFFEIGGHSLKATLLMSKIHQAFDVKLHLTEIFVSPSIRQLAASIEASAQDHFCSISPTEKEDYYPLSSAQKRLYLLYRIDPQSIGYNIPVVMEVEGEIHKEKFENTLRELIRRHESLRTYFQEVEGKPVQRICQLKEFEIENDRSLVNCQGRGEVPSPNKVDKIIHNFIRPFDLTRAPLMRVGLIKLLYTPTAFRGHPGREGKEDRYLLMMDMHHIISDGTSMGILVQEFMALNQGEELPVSRVRYRDYAEWQRREKQAETLEHQEAFWLAEYEEEIPILDLPTDYIRPKVQDFAGSTLSFEIDVKETRALNRLAAEQEATLFMVLFALYEIFLARMSSQEVVVVGTSSAGRQHADLAPIIGMFVNTLALKGEPSGEKTFREFLKEVKEKTLHAFANQDYQYEDLVEHLPVNRDTGRNPLFDTMLVLQNLEIPEIEVPGLKLRPYRYEHSISKFDLMLQCIETGNHLSLLFEYSTKLFKEETIEKFTGYFKKVVSTVLENPGGKISAIEIITVEEKNRLLIDFNRTTAEYPREKPIHLLFARQAEQHPDHTALKGKEGGKGRKGEGKNISISYGELNKKARQLAAILTEQGVTNDSVVGLLVEPGVEMMIGMIGILKAGGAYLPLDPAIPSGRIAYMINDAALRIILTNKQAAAKEVFAGKIIDLHRREIYKGSPGKSTDETHPHHMAYVIYTSGSTGQPKGTAVEHSQLVNFVFHMYNRYEREVNFDDRCLSLTNIMFDVSVWEFFLPLSFGAQLVLLTEEKRFDVLALAQVILREEITLIYLPPGLLKPVNEELRKESDRLKLNKMLVGVEPIRDEVLENYMRLNPKMRIINGYGPTETTICATSLNYSPHPPRGEIVPIGVPLANNQVVLLDNAGHIVPRGIAGEICISGDGVTRGYLNNPGLTAEKYTPHPYLKGKRMYRTGDLARLLPEGNIRFIGRRDQQLKLRGYRIEIGEIENRLLKHPGIKQALVQAQTDEQAGKYLCAYLVASTKLEIPALREYLSKDLPDYMIPSYFVPLEKIPLTANGKVDGKALPKPRIELEPQNYTAPRDKIEKKLVEIWSAVLGIEMEKIGIDENFFHLGGHSLKATQLATKIQKEMDVNVPLTEIFNISHIRGLAAYIKKSAAVKYIPIEPVEKKDYYSLSSAQKRLFILQQIDKQGIVYNIPSPWKLEGFIDKEKLQETFLKLVQRHESLRTSFHLLENEPVQRIHDEVTFEIEYYDIKEGTMGLDPLSLDHANRNRQSAATLVSSFIRPFDLSCAPLVRIGLIKLLHNPTALHGHPSQEGKEARYLLVVDMHHIISDGTSIQVLIKDFTALYEGWNLPLPGLQYKDFSGWQNSSQQKAAIKNQEQYWMKEFGNEIPVLDLPTDFTRPLVHDFAGSALTFETGRDETLALKSLAQEQRTTLFMVLLSLYTIFLAKLGRQEDIVVGTPIAGRRHPGLEPIIGMFVNTLALRNYPVGEKRFKDFLKEVKENASTAFKNQDYPFEELVKLLGIERDIGRNPLFDVMFAMQNLEMETKKIEIGDLRLTPYRYQWRVSRVDLSLACQESKQNLFFTIEYSTKLFKEETITRFVNYFKKIISSIVEAPGNKISRVEIITAEEKKQILSDFNNPKTQYPQDKTIHGLFAGQVEQTPDHIAAAAPAEKEYMTHMTYISYRELNRKSDQLAVILKEKGVGANDIIAIQIERSLEMIIAILGILKADGAYLPIDPDSPGERSKYILNDSNAKILVKKGGGTPNPFTVRQMPFFRSFNSKVCRKNKVSEGISNSIINPILETSIAVIFIDEVLNKISPENVFSHPHLTPAPVTSLAYIIYTSGSTGRPKGVPISHMNFSPLVHWGYDISGIGPGDRVVQNLSYFFDWSVWEIFISLTTGSVLLMVPAEVILNPRQYIDFMEYNQVTVLHITPTHFQALVKEGSKLNTLKYLAIGAEKLTFDLLERSFEVVNRDCRVFNMYGPTEATIMSAVLEAPRREEGTFSAYPELTSVPIGVPIANLCLLVVDRYFNLCPVFVPGELLIAGSGLSRGYLNNPELTAREFCPLRPGRALFEETRELAPLLPPYPIAPLPHHPHYRTGDLARWLYDSNIEFLGRLDQQLKIRGFRIELGEIENQLLNYPGINGAVVVVKENKFQDKRLYAYIVTGKSFDETALEKLLTKALPEYMIPSSFIRLESMPLNPNGKIDHKALPEPEIKMEDDYTPPGTEIEKKLTQIWSEILEIEQNLIGINSNFFKIGGHSLIAARLIARIDKELNVKVPLAEIFRTLSIRGLAKFIENTAKTSYSLLKAAEKKEYYPVSSAQKRLYVLQRMAEGKTGIVYNIPSVFTAQGEIDKEKLEKTFMELIKRHESLRTSFEMPETEPVQKVHEEVEFEIEYYQVEVKAAVEVREEQSSRLEGTRGLAPLAEESHLSSVIRHLSSEFIRPFELSRAPLLRVGLTRLEEKKHLLMVDIHHIISDGISIAIVMQDFTQLQAGRELPRLKLHYKDYAQWQADNNQSREMQKQQEYWLRQYQGEIPRLKLPTDFNRSAAPMFAGDTLQFEIGPRETKALNQLAHEEDATMYMVLQALLDILLYKMTGQQDIIIGTVVAGRSHPSLEGITGMFVNTLALRNYPAGEKTASQFIQEVKTRMLEAFENQDYPFAELVDQLGGPGKTGYNPLFDVMFTVNNIDMQPLEIPGLKLTPHPLETKTAKFDLTLTVYTGDTLVIDMEYRTQLFTKQRMQRYAGYFKEIAAAVLENRETRLADISISVDLIEARDIEMEETFDF